MEIIDKEVYFNKYCKQCVYKDLKEEEKPCNECLTYPYNTNSHKPIMFKKADNIKEK